MSDNKHLIENYRGHDIYYDEDKEKFVCDISIEDNLKSTSRISLKACRQEVDAFIKENLDFKPFKIVNLGYGDNFSGEADVYDVVGVRADGAIIMEQDDKYREGQKRREYKMANDSDAESIKKYNPDIFELEKEWKEHSAIWDKKRKDIQERANKILKHIDWKYVEQFKKKV